MIYFSAHLLLGKVVTSKKILDMMRFAGFIQKQAAASHTIL